MGSYNLNDARAISYFNKNGELVPVKEVWYKGTYRNYKIWPGDVYMTDIKIEDQYGNVYDYKYDSNNNPSYTRNGTVYTGLSPNVKYYIKGTIKSMMVQNGENVLRETIENCYPETYTVKEWSGGTSDWSPIWSYTKAGTKYNSMVDMYRPYDGFSCTADYATSGSDDNVYFIPKMGYWTPWSNEGQVELGYIGEKVDYGIKLKRVPIVVEFGGNLSESVMLAKDEEYTADCTMVTSWGGPTPGSSTTGSVTIINENTDKIQVTHSGGKLKIKCLTMDSGTYNYTVKATAYGRSIEDKKQVVVVGPMYRLQAPYGPNCINVGGTMTISADQIVVVYRNISSDSSNENFTKFDNFSLLSSDDNIVGVRSNTILEPRKSGTATITGTDKELGTTFKFTCKVELVNTPTYIKVGYGTDPTNSTWFNVNSFSDGLRYDIPKCKQISVFICTDSSGTTFKDAYYTLESRGGYSNNSPDGSTAYGIYINVDNGSTAHDFVYKLYTDSSKSNYIGSFTIGYL